MVTEWGMSDKLGPLTFGERQEMVFLGRDLGEQRNYSEGIASEIDQEVHQLVADAFQRAKKVLREREHVLRALASRLVEVETMDAPEMERIIQEAETRSGDAVGQRQRAHRSMRRRRRRRLRSTRRGSGRSVGVHSGRSGQSRPSTAEADPGTRGAPRGAAARDGRLSRLEQRLDPGGPRRGGQGSAVAGGRWSRPGWFRTGDRRA